MDDQNPCFPVQIPVSIYMKNPKHLIKNRLLRRNVHDIHKESYQEVRQKGALSKHFRGIRKKWQCSIQGRGRLPPRSDHL